MSNAAELRRLFLNFFVSRGHTPRLSVPLIPVGDPTLMFTSAGMVPFKPYFLGQRTDLTRATSVQKCFRTTDIERVGTTLRHLTFFEMLGNFSFGDYFKKDAVAWCWEFLTKDVGLDPKKLHPTVFREDDDAFELWKKQGTPNAPIRLNEDNNFWSSGPTGPCGPCSEVYVDRGLSYGCGKAGCAPGCDCDRFLEIWNLVFMQFDRQQDGSLKPLPRQNIDTGMGLERLALVVQDKAAPFDTDLFRPVVERASSLLGAAPDKNPLAFRVIADHARAATMLMSEGLIPSNVERGYVLRRLIRRAVRYGQLLGHPEPFLHKLVPGVVEIFKDAYPELGEQAAQAVPTMKAEEERFLETLQSGERELSAVLEKTQGTLPGEEAFKLYDTFGFPLELTREICGQRGLKVDEAGFKAAASRAQEVARASWKGSGEKGASIALPASAQTRFTGYESLEESTVVAAAELKGGRGVVVLEATPFYPEGGGQVGDEGWLLTADGKNPLARVVDTQKQGHAVLHLVDQASAELKAGLKVTAKVDAARRAYVRPHHTGTHLLNEALRRVLGAHVRQAGSYVGPDKLRFDFTHPKALEPEQIREIERIVNEEIARGEPVATKVESVEKVKEYGALTLLGEDYGQRPRFVLIGSKGWSDPKDRFSLELCGGTHCANTAEIKRLKIVKESSAAAGVRRIEALAGGALADWEAARAQEAEQSVAHLVERERQLLAEVASLGGKAEASGPAQRTEAQLRARERELKELIAKLKDKKLAAQTEGDWETRTVKGFVFALKRLEGADPKSLRGLSDKKKSELGSGLVFLATPAGGKLSFVLAATPDLAGKGVDASKVAKAFAAANGGSAGGRADFAQGGAADKDWSALVEDLVAAIGAGYTPSTPK